MWNRSAYSFSVEQWRALINFRGPCWVRISQECFQANYLFIVSGVSIIFTVPPPLTAHQRAHSIVARLLRNELDCIAKQKEKEKRTSLDARLIGRLLLVTHRTPAQHM